MSQALFSQSAIAVPFVPSISAHCPRTLYVTIKLDIIPSLFDQLKIIFSLLLLKSSEPIIYIAPQNAAAAELVSQTERACSL